MTLPDPPASSSAGRGGEHTGEHEVFEKIWASTSLFYSGGNIAASRTFPELWEAVKFQRLNEFLPNTPQKALEVGCGSGGVSLYLHNAHNYQVELVDLSDEALRFAERNFAQNAKPNPPRAIFRKADATQLPYEANSFDVVMSFGLLEHFTDIEKPMAEQMRVLKPGGVFLADIVTERFSVDTFGRLPATLKKIGRTVLSGRWAELGQATRADFFENNYSLDTYVRAVQKYGGRVTHTLGNRPVTSLGRLPVVAPLMLNSFKSSAFQKWWRDFDLSGSAFSKWWGAGWWVRAIKQ